MQFGHYLLEYAYSLFYSDNSHKFHSMKGKLHFALLCEVKELIWGLATDTEGILYFATKSGVWKISRHNYQPVLVSNKRMHGIVLSGNTLYGCDAWLNNLYQVDVHTGQVISLTPACSPGCKDGPLKEASFRVPYGITMDDKGILYVADSRSVRKVNLTEGTVETLAGTGSFGSQDGPALQASFGDLCSIAVAPDGSVYVVDGLYPSVRKIKDGKVTTVGKGDVYLQTPYGIAIDDYGNILVADSAKEIKRIDSTRPHLNDYLSATVNKPKCITTDKSGTIYVGTADNKLYKIVRGFQWKTFRLLWIANMKESTSYCPLASVPKDIIRAIIVELLLCPL